MTEEKRLGEKSDHWPKRNPNPDLWNKVKELAKNDDGKNEAIDIIFKQNYELPEESLELIKKLSTADQPKNVRLQIAKNLGIYKEIPFGMYIDLYKVLSSDPDTDVMRSLAFESSLIDISKSLQDALTMVRPETLSFLSETVLKQQKELTKALAPLFNLQKSPVFNQISSIQSIKLAEQLTNLNEKLNFPALKDIKIPKSPFTIDDISLKDVKSKGVSVNAILSKTAEKNPELKNAIEVSEQIQNFPQQIINQIAEINKTIASFADTTGNSLKEIDEKQEKTHRTINQKLSPKQTIGVALVVGIVASFSGSIVFSVWEYLGTLVSNTPTIVNSTMP